MPLEAPLVVHRPPAPVRTEYRVGLCAWQDRSMVERGHLDDAPAINGIQIKELLGLTVPEREGVLAEWRERRRQPRS